MIYTLNIAFCGQSLNCARSMNCTSNSLQGIAQGPQLKKESTSNGLFFGGGRGSTELTVKNVD
uniref:Uncharacterized protein n=1 Tax=Anguilla anguilla TaxID=7936 RepID=A0A0E9ST59_ANGAN